MRELAVSFQDPPFDLCPRLGHGRLGLARQRGCDDRALCTCDKLGMDAVSVAADRLGYVLGCYW